MEKVQWNSIDKTQNGINEKINHPPSPDQFFFPNSYILERTILTLVFVTLLTKYIPTNWWLLSAIF